MKDNVKLSGFIVLFVGVGVLIFTFCSAYLLLGGVLAIPGSQGLMEVFGVAMGPLIESAIRVLYLGVMGWIGSILTRRGVQIVIVERENIHVKPMLKVEGIKETNENKNVENMPLVPQTRQTSETAISEPVGQT